MTMQVFRITTAAWSDKLHASGKAARWNHPGMDVIYTSGSRSLACLENLVHRGTSASIGLFRTMVIEIPDPVGIRNTDHLKFPADWFSDPSRSWSRTTGSEWIGAGRSAVLRVPSAIIPEEYNFLINPKHPDFSKIRLLRTETFRFDPRIFAKG